MWQAGTRLEKTANKCFSKRMQCLKMFWDAILISLLTEVLCLITASIVSLNWSRLRDLFEESWLMREDVGEELCFSESSLEFKSTLVSVAFSLNFDTSTVNPGGSERVHLRVCFFYRARNASFYLPLYRLSAAGRMLRRRKCCQPTYTIMQIKL